MILRSKQEASLIAQTNFSTSHMEWSVKPAPDSNAVRWSMFGISSTTLLPRKLLAFGLTSCLIIFWVIPTALIQTLSNINSLSQTPTFSWLSFVKTLGPELGFIQGLLPAIILEVVMIIVPKLLRRIVLLQRICSEVDVEREVLNKMIAFLYFSHLIYVVLSGSLLEYADEIVANPSNIVNIMATSIPQQGTFMMNVILLATVVQTPIQIVQPVRLLKRWFGMRRALTKRDRELVNNEDSVTDHFEEYAKGAIFTVLGLVYSTLAPVLLFMCTAFFTINYIVHKHKMVYTKTTAWEGFGSLHQVALQGIAVGLIVHMTMGGLMGLNGHGVLAGLEFSCAVIIWSVIIVYKRRLLPIINHGALADHAKLESFDTLKRGLSGAGLASSETKSIEMARESYQPPGLQPLEGLDSEI